MIDIKELLFQTGKKNEVIDDRLSREKAEKRMESECIEDAGVSFQKIGDAVLGLGTILDVNEEKQYYLTTVSVNATAAILIACISKENTVEAAAYAKEGIIRQHLARKALDTFKQRLLSLHSYGNK